MNIKRTLLYNFGKRRASHLNLGREKALSTILVTNFEQNIQVASTQILKTVGNGQQVHQKKKLADHLPKERRAFSQHDPEVWCNEFVLI